VTSCRDDRQDPPFAYRTHAGGIMVRMVNGPAPSLRVGVPEDAAGLTCPYMRARVMAMPWLLHLHDKALTGWWMQHVVLGGQRVRVVESGNGLWGFAAVDDGWLEQLYVDPDRQRVGVGRMLLDDAKQARPAGLSLHVSLATPGLGASTRPPASCWSTRATAGTTRSRNWTAPTPGQRRPRAPVDDHPSDVSLTARGRVEAIGSGKGVHHERASSVGPAWAWRLVRLPAVAALVADLCQQRPPARRARRGRPGDRHGWER